MEGDGKGGQSETETQGEGFELRFCKIKVPKLVQELTVSEKKKALGP